MAGMLEAQAHDETGEAVSGDDKGRHVRGSSIQSASGALVTWQAPATCPKEVVQPPAMAKCSVVPVEDKDRRACARTVAGVVACVYRAAPA